MPTTKTSQRPLVSLALPRPVAALITYAGQILKAMTGNPSFPSPSPTLAVVQQAVDDLQTAEAAALARTKGAVQTRNRGGHHRDVPLRTLAKTGQSDWVAPVSLLVK